MTQDSDVLYMLILNISCDKKPTILNTYDIYQEVKITRTHR